MSYTTACLIMSRVIQRPPKKLAADRMMARAAEHLARETLALGLWGDRRRDGRGGDAGDVARGVLAIVVGRSQRGGGGLEPIGEIVGVASVLRRAGRVIAVMSFSAVVV